MVIAPRGSPGERHSGTGAGRVDPPHAARDERADERAGDALRHRPAGERHVGSEARCVALGDDPVAVDDHDRPRPARRCGPGLGECLVEGLLEAGVGRCPVERRRSCHRRQLRCRRFERFDARTDRQRAPESLAVHGLPPGEPEHGRGRDASRAVDRNADRRERGVPISVDVLGDHRFRRAARHEHARAHRLRGEAGRDVRHAPDVPPAPGERPRARAPRSRRSPPRRRGSAGSCRRGRRAPAPALRSSLRPG